MEEARSPGESDRLASTRVSGLSHWWSAVIAYNWVSGLLGAILGALVGGFVVWITRILGTIVRLYRSERPLSFFTGVGVALAIVSIGLAIPIFVTYLEEGIVPRIPTAILSTGLMLAGFLAVVAGLVLDTVTRGRREMKLIAYLGQRAPGEDFDRRQS